MKKYLIVLSLLLASCVSPFAGVQQAHIDKATEVCKNNSGISMITYAEASNSGNYRFYEMNVHCMNTASFNLTWRVKND